MRPRIPLIATSFLVALGPFVCASLSGEAALDEPQPRLPTPPQTRGKVADRPKSVSRAGPQTRRRLSPREIVDIVTRSLVLVVTQDPDGRPVSQGSGFFFQEDLVATSLHVFKRASQGYVKPTSGGTTHKIAEVVGIDLVHDLCVFRVIGSARQALKLGGSSIVAGDEIYVGGSPEGLEGSFSKGIISGIRSNEGLLQLDAAISPGSSGGPVVNSTAEVIGIVASTLLGGQNLNFAIPVSFLAALPTKWNAPVLVAGALSVTDRDEDKLRGPVQSVTTKAAKYYHDERTNRYVERPGEISSIERYDDLGSKTESVLYNTSQNGGSVVLTLIYEYSPSGYRAIVTSRMTTSNGTHESVRRLTFGEAIAEKVAQRRFSITQKTQDLPSPGGTTTVTCDRFGNAVEMVIKGSDGYDRSVWSYDTNGFETALTVYKPKQVSSFRYTYEFDRWGNWIKRYETSNSGVSADVAFRLSEVRYREISYRSD